MKVRCPWLSTPSKDEFLGSFDRSRRFADTSEKLGVGIKRVEMSEI